MSGRACVSWGLQWKRTEEEALLGVQRGPLSHGIWHAAWKAGCGVRVPASVIQGRFLKGSQPWKGDPGIPGTANHTLGRAQRPAGFRLPPVPVFQPPRSDGQRPAQRLPRAGVQHLQWSPSMLPSEAGLLSLPSPQPRVTVREPAPAPPPARPGAPTRLPPHCSVLPRKPAPQLSPLLPAGSADLSAVLVMLQPLVGMPTAFELSAADVGGGGSASELGPGWSLWGLQCFSTKPSYLDRSNTTTWKLERPLLISADGDCGAVVTGCAERGFPRHQS